MHLRNADIISAIRRVAERRIEHAMRQRNFDNLPDPAKHLHLETEPTRLPHRLCPP
ncbi:MAG: hypothetical protein NTU53_20335 [Planctomycetota bacterium]|nr:hypothetical protein [Planctomycetota bacterium]